jgi:glycosyltransferase involved in cell wall biosynthesis
MNAITTVIITKNEGQNIEACIRSAKLVSEEIIVVDCGSIDNTVLLAKNEGAKIIEVEWQCYGHSRNTGAAAAKNNWILSLDADERISTPLGSILSQMELQDSSCIYKIRRENFFQNQKLNYGTLGFEKVPKLYHRHNATWDLFPVHERLITNGHTKTIKQSILHFGIPGLQEHIEKKEHYALLSAKKYIQQGKRPTFIKRYLSPVFNGLKSYFFQAGFLDGKKGWDIAFTISYYTWLKYKYLKQLTSKKQDSIISPANISYKVAPNSFSLKR